MQLNLGIWRGLAIGLGGLRRACNWASGFEEGLQLDLRV